MSKEANKQKRKAAAATAAVPLIDNRLIPKPLQVKPGEPCSITVNISGLPPPVVRWQIGRRRVKESSKYQLTTDGLLGHTLVIARATEDLEQGVWVVASNEHGEDCCQIEVDAHTLNDDEMSGRRSSRRPPVASTPEMTQKSSILRKKKSRRVGETQSVASLDAWTTGSTPESSKRLPSVDDITTAPDNSLVTTPSDLNQSLDSEAILSGRRRKRTGPKPSRFSSTDAIYSRAPLSLAPGRQDSLSSVTTIDATGPATDGSAFLDKGTETHLAEETSATRKKKKNSLRKKGSGSRSSLASNGAVDASNAKNKEAATNTEEVVIEPVKTIEPEEKISSAKEMVGPSIPLETTEDGKLLWELLGMRLNLLCRELLTDIQSNLDAEHKEEIETVLDGDHSSEPELVVGNGLQQEDQPQPQQQHQQHQQQETSVDDEEEIIRRMVESRQIPVTDLDDFDRDEDDEEEEPPLLMEAQQKETRVDDDVKENPPTLGDGKGSGWKTAPVQKPGEDIPDAQSLRRPIKEKTGSAVDGDADDKTTKANGAIPSIAIYDVQGSMVEPLANEPQRRRSGKVNPQDMKLESIQHKRNETEERESDESNQEISGPAAKKEPKVKESEKEEPPKKEDKQELETKESFRKEPEMKEPGRTKPELKERSRKETETKEPVITKPEIKERPRKESETKESVITKPEIKQRSRKESETKEPVITKPETKEPFRKETETKEPVITKPAIREKENTDPEENDSEITESLREEPETKEPFRRKPETKEEVRTKSEVKDRTETIRKEPLRKEHDKKEPGTREPFVTEPAKKEPAKRDPDKDQAALEDKRKDEYHEEQSAVKLSKPVPRKHSPTSEMKTDTGRIQDKPPSGKKKHPMSPVDDNDLSTTRGVIHSGYRPLPSPRKLSSSGGPSESDDRTLAENVGRDGAEAPPAGAPRSPSGRDLDMHNGGGITYSRQKERDESGDSPLPNSIHKPKTDNCPIVLTTYIIHSGTKSRQTPKAGEHLVSKGHDGVDGSSLNDPRSTPASKTSASAIASDAAPEKQRSSPASASSPIVPERAGRTTADDRDQVIRRQRGQSADRVITRQESDRKMMIVDIDIDDQQGNSRADPNRGSSNLYRSASGILSTSEGTTDTAVTEDLTQRPPKPRPRISLKPARSEESLATKSASVGRTNKDDGSDRRFLRGAKSVESLSATGSDSSFVSRLGRRTMSQEWQVVTVTTTTEEIVVIGQPKNKTESNQRTDPVSKEIKADQKKESNQRINLTSKEIKNDQKPEGLQAGTKSDKATGIVEDKGKQKQSNKTISDGLLVWMQNEANKEGKEENLGDRPSEASKDGEKLNDEQLGRTKEKKPLQLPKDVIGFQEQTKRSVNETGSQTVDDSENIQEDEHLRPKQGSSETHEDAQVRVPVETAQNKTVDTNNQVPEEIAGNPTYITSATIFLTSPKIKDDSAKPHRYLDTGSKPPIRLRLSSHDTSTQTDEELTETQTQTQTNADLNEQATTFVSRNEEESDKSNIKKSPTHSEAKHISSAVVYEYGEIISFYLDTRSGLNVEPPTPQLERIRLESNEPVTALVTDTRDVIVLSNATDRNTDTGNSDKDNIGTTDFPNRNLKADETSRETTHEDDDRRPRPTAFSSGSDDSARESEPIESFVALRSLKPGTVPSKTKESSAGNRRLRVSAADYLFPSEPGAMSPKTKESSAEDYDDRRSQPTTISSGSDDSPHGREPIESLVALPSSKPGPVPPKPKESSAGHHRPAVSAANNAFPSELGTVSPKLKENSAEHHRLPVSAADNVFPSEPGTVSPKTKESSAEHNRLRVSAADYLFPSEPGTESPKAKESTGGHDRLPISAADYNVPSKPGTLSKKTKESSAEDYDERRSQPTTISSGSDDSAHGSEPIESFVALRYSRPGPVSPKPKESSAEHHPPPASADDNVFTSEPGAVFSKPNESGAEHRRLRVSAADYLFPSEPGTMSPKRKESSAEDYDDKRSQPTRISSGSDRSPHGSEHIESLVALPSSKPGPVSPKPKESSAGHHRPPVSSADYVFPSEPSPASPKPKESSPGHHRPPISVDDNVSTSEPGAVFSKPNESGAEHRRLRVSAADYLFPSEPGTVSPKPKESTGGHDRLPVSAADYNFPSKPEKPTLKPKERSAEDHDDKRSQPARISSGSDDSPRGSEPIELIVPSSKPVSPNTTESSTGHQRLPVSAADYNFPSKPGTLSRETKESMEDNDDRKPQPTRISSGSDDFPHGSEPTESFVALRSSNPGSAPPKPKESNAGHHRLPVSTDDVVTSEPGTVSPKPKESGVEHRRLRVSAADYLFPSEPDTMSPKTKESSAEDYDDRRSQPKRISSGSDRSPHGSEHTESLVALPSSKPGPVPPKPKESSAEHHRPPVSADDNVFPSEPDKVSPKTKESHAEYHHLPISAADDIFHALTQSTATNDAIQDQSIVTTNLPLREISSSEQGEINRTDDEEVLLQHDERHLIRLQAAADESEDVSDQSDEESHQSSVSSAPSCDTVIRVAIREPNEAVNDYVLSALPTSSVHSEPTKSPGDGTDDDDVEELDSAVTVLQDDSTPAEDRRRQDEEEETGAVGGIPAAFKDDKAKGNEAQPRRRLPDRPRVEPPDEVMDEKTFVQCALSSLGTIIFLAVAAIIFHFLNNIVGDQME